MRSIFKTVTLVLALVSFIQIAQAQNAITLNEEHFWQEKQSDALEDYLSDQNIETAKPNWQKVELINQEKNTLYSGEEYMFHSSSQGLIVDLLDSQAKEVVVHITGPSGKSKIYHSVNQILLKESENGIYKLKLEKSLTGHVDFRVFSASYMLDLGRPLLITSDEENYPYIKENLRNFLSNGGSIINIGSETINTWVEEQLPQLESTKIEGDNSDLKYFSHRYFYAPKEVFLNEEKAFLVTQKVKEKILNFDIYKILHRWGIFLTLFLGFIYGGYLFYIKRPSMGGIILKHRKSDTNNNQKALGILWRVISLSAFCIFAIYVYKNYSGLDLFPDFTIDGLIAKWNLDVIGAVILAVTIFLSVYLHSKNFLQYMKLPFLKSYLWITVLLLGGSGLLFLLSNLRPDVKFMRVDFPLVVSNDDLNLLEELWPTQKEILSKLTTWVPLQERNFYAEIGENIYYIETDNTLTGNVVIRTKNNEFANKDFYINLTSLDGEVVASKYIDVQDNLIGSKKIIAIYPFDFGVNAPGIYALKLENSYIGKISDSELISIFGNYKKIISINEVQDLKTINLSEKRIDFDEIKTWQNDRILDKKIYLY